MIYGIGTDIIQISRIEAALARNGDRFAQRILGPEEYAKYQRRRDKVAVRGIRFLATRFAAKEAFSKAIGLGMRMPMTWRGVLKHYMDDNGLSAQVTLTDEADYAVAFVIVEKNA